MITAVVILACVAILWLWERREVRQIEAANPPQGKLVALDDAVVHVTMRDPVGVFRGNVLLLHGASGNQADMMLALGDRLAAKGFRVFAADRPGHGWSTRPPGSESPAAQAKIVRAALEKLGAAHAIVVGHSLAGAMTVDFVLREADFADGAVLVAPVTHPWPTGIAWYYSAATAPWTGGLFANLVVLPFGLASIDKAVAAVFAPNVPPPDYVARTGAKLVLRPLEFIANAEDVAGLHDFVAQQAPHEPEIRRPVAIVTGDRDGVVLTHVHSDGSKRDIPGATLTVLPGVGHSPHWVEPDAVVAAVEEVAARVQMARETRPATPVSAPAASSQ